jgi:signal transduction histidine kinase
MPIIVRGHVAGVLYASRTPVNVFKGLYEQRHKASLAVAAILALTLLIGVAFHLTIAGPIRELLSRTTAIAGGDRRAIRPLRRHGTQELASLTQGFLDMANNLAARSDYVTTFAAHVSHELKSPLTSILGAAELLRDGVSGAADAMDDDARQRLTAIVNRLRELARAEALPFPGSAMLASVAAELRANFPALAMRLSGDLDQPIVISSENFRIILGHLADNSTHHGAESFEVDVRRQGRVVCLTVRDDGTGIAFNNRARVFDDFFTTRQEGGGTGMGLAIVRAMLTAHHGTIELHDSTAGATFVLTLPAGTLADKPPISHRVVGIWPVGV